VVEPGLRLLAPGRAPGLGGRFFGRGLAARTALRLARSADLARVASLAAVFPACHSSNVPDYGHYSTDYKLRTTNEEGWPVISGQWAGRSVGIALRLCVNFRRRSAV